ncbi:sodium-dependent transporter [Streptococcus infantis SK1302]|uniref:Sodium-dependent transporter n=1 Tax=Streptococcus infantis SK1302 TaxID=871237 RepID=A0ABP2J874_9STRE|nr:sodium-dependent transporter [Streptococcus infantis SK1302]
MKIAFLTGFRKHDRIIKSINQRISSKEPLREGYLTTQVAFSYFKNRLEF